MKKRLFSILMTLALCLSLLPTVVLSEEPPSYTINADGKLIISGTTDGSDLPDKGFTSIEITSTGVVNNGIYTVDVENYGTINGGTFTKELYSLDNYGTINGGDFDDVLNRTTGGLITGGTFDSVSNYGNMTGGTVGTLHNINTVANGCTVRGVTITGSISNNNSICYSMDLRIDLANVHDGFGSITYVAMTVDGQTTECPVGWNAKGWLNTYVASATWYKLVDGVKTPLTDTEVVPCQPVEYVSNLVPMIVNGSERICPAGELADSWLRNVEANNWYRLDGEEWVQLTDTDVFPETKTVYSTIPGKSLGTMGSMADINGNWIARVGDTLGVFNGAAAWYVDNQPVAGQNEGWRVTYIIQKQDLGKEAVAVLTDGYATIKSTPVRIVDSLSVTVPATIPAGRTITPAFNWQLITSPAAGMTYQWKRDNVAIEGATSDTYTTTDDDINHSLTLAISIKGTPSYETSSVNVLEAYTVSFNANGGTGTMEAATNILGTYPLPANGFTAPEGKQFKGWATTADGEIISDTSIEVTDNMTLYAIWENIPHSHSYSTAWKFDAANHWHECECGDKTAETPHSFEWVIDKEATDTAKGLKHEECKDCGYSKAAVEIPETGETTTPATGDNSMMWLWLVLLLVSGTGITGVAVYGKRKMAE